MGDKSYNNPSEDEKSTDLNKNPPQSQGESENCDQSELETQDIESLGLKNNNMLDDESSLEETVDAASPIGINHEEAQNVLDREILNKKSESLLVGKSQYSKTESDEFSSTQTTDGNSRVDDSSLQTQEDSKPAFPKNNSDNVLPSKKTSSPSDSVSSIEEKTGVIDIQKANKDQKKKRQTMSLSIGKSISRFGQTVYEEYELIKPSYIWGLAVLFVILLSFQVPFIHEIEMKVQDFWTKYRGDRKFDSQVSLVEIQDECLKEIGDWPWDRSKHALVLDILNQYFNPKLVLFDILFTEQAAKKILINGKEKITNLKAHLSDIAFSKKISKIKNVILPGYFIKGVSGVLYKTEELSFNGPHELFKKGIKSNTHISYEEDSDGILRRIPLVIKHKKDWVFHLSLSAVLAYLNIKEGDVNIELGKYITFRSKKGKLYQIPIDENGCLLINWYGDFKSTYEHFGYRDIIQSKAGFTLENVEPRLKVNQLKNKILIIGFSATGLMDHKPVPIEKSFPLMGVHAQLINQILDQSFLKELPDWIELILCIFCSLLMLWTSLKFSPKKSLMITTLSATIICLSSFICFKYFSIQLAVIKPLIAIGLTSFVFALYSHIRFKDHVDLKLSFEQKLNMADAKLPQFRPNLKIGPYGHIKELGRGGMAIVYRGQDNSGQVVAVKVINPEYLSKEGYKYRFKREIMTMKKVNHPNVIKIYDSGTFQGVLYYSMELFEAGDLAMHLESLHKKTDWKWLAHFFASLAGGLQAIHESGLIHRDIKPANIMVNDEYQVKIADFGLARGEQDGQLLTTVGQVLGTPAYLAPELCIGEDPTFSADIYAMGIIFYEIIAGQRPFNEAKTMAALMHAKIKSPIITVRSKRPDVPVEIAQIIDKMVTQKPEQRPSSMKEIEDILLSFSQQQVKI